jgi:hypothetical protein
MSPGNEGARLGGTHVAGSVKCTLPSSSSPIGIPLEDHSSAQSSLRVQRGVCQETSPGG